MNDDKKSHEDDGSPEVTVTCKKGQVTITAEANRPNDKAVPADKEEHTAVCDGIEYKPISCAYSAPTLTLIFKFVVSTKKHNDHEAKVTVVWMTPASYEGNGSTSKHEGTTL